MVQSHALYFVYQICVENTIKLIKNISDECDSCLGVQEIELVGIFTLLDTHINSFQILFKFFQNDRKSEIQQFQTTHHMHSS